MLKTWLVLTGVAVVLVAAAMAPTQTVRVGGEAVTSRPAPTSGPARPGAFPAGGEAMGVDRLKTQMHATDEEWKVIGPQLQKVVAARRVAESGTIRDGSGMSGAGGGFGGPGGRGRGGFGGPGGGPGGGGFNGPGGGPGGGSFSGPGGGPGGGRGRGGGGFGRGGFGGPGGPPGGDAPPPGDFGPPPGEPAGPTAASGPAPVDPSAPGPGRLVPSGADASAILGTGSSAITQALANLQATVADANHTPEQIKEKISAVRSARQKARAELDSAQTDLRQLLTSDQEALLIALGYLD